MKIILAKKIQSKNCPHVLNWILAVSLLLVLSLPVGASESWTNWTWVNIGLSIPQTNLTVGGKINASILVSNTVDEARIVYRDSGPCNCGFGYFSIIEVSSGKKIKYPFVPSGFGSFQPLAGHKFESFDFDLTDGYVITNAGLYSVSVVGWFPLNEPPTNSQHAMVETPSIIINILPKVETNAPNHVSK